MSQECQEIQRVLTAVCASWSGEWYKLSYYYSDAVIIPLQNEQALRGYRRARDTEGLASIKERMGDYDGAIRLLLKHDRITDALKYATKYEAQISQCYNPHYLAIKYAEKLLKPTVQTSQDDLEQLEAAMEYLTPTERVNFYKAADMHEKACEVLKSEGRYRDLYRIFKAQGWHEEGIQTAKSRRHREDEATFILFKATGELSSEHGSLEENTTAMLKKKFDIDTEIGAKTALIYGSAMQNPTMIKTAQRYYKKYHNSIGLIEAFNIAVARVEYDDARKIRNIHLDRNEDLLTSALIICKEIRHVAASLDPTEEPSSVQKQIISQLERFYGLEKKKVGEDLDDLYFIPFSSYPWTNQLLEDLKIGKRVVDSDGMLELGVETVFKGVCTRIESYIEKWIVLDKLGLVEHFNESFTTHPLHQEIAAGDYSHQSSIAHSKELKSQQGYFRLLCNAFDLAHYGSTKIASKSSLFKAVLNAISLFATGYLPIMYLNVHSDFLTQKLNEEVIEVFTKKDRAFDFDKWFEAWRINCVSRKGSQKMREILFRRSEQSNKNVDEYEKSQDTPHFSIPPVYVLDRHNRRYTHLMLLWLRACELFREKNTLTSCTIAVYSIVRHIASVQSIWNTVSLSNLLNMVTILTTAILTMHAACCARFQHEGNVYFPHSYKNVADVFHNMNGPSNMDFHKSCIHYVRNKRGLHEVPPKLEKMLNFVLKVMIGVHDGRFNPLKEAMGTEECLKNGEARQCLVLVLILFCNISIIKFDTTTLQKYRHYIYGSVKQCKDPTLVEAYSRFLNSRTLLGCFGAARELLETSQDSLLQAHVFLDFRLNDIDIKFSPARLNSAIFQKLQLIPFPIQLAPQHSKPVVMRSSLRVDAVPFIPSFGTPTVDQGLNQLTSLPLSSPTDPTIPDIPPNFLTMDSVEADEDDPETRAALNIEPEHTPAPQSILEKDSPVDYSFCLICACEVGNSSENEPSTDPSSILESAESLYNNHIHSERHITNFELKMQFDSEEKEYFVPAKNELFELLPKCGSLGQFRHDDKIQHIMDEIQGEIKKMDDSLLNIRYSGEWKEGTSLLQYDFPGKIQSLRMKSTRLIEETEKIKREIERGAEQQERKDEEELMEDEQPDEDEDIVQARADYGEKGKEKSRKRKKLKRERRS